MATYRPVYINIWKDPTFEGYKPSMKLIFIYLITNESTTESGIYPITIKTISNETGIPVKTVEQLLSNGLKNVAYDFENNFIFIKNFLKYSSGGGRPDLLQKSIEKNYKNFNTPLWDEFKIIYPQYSQEIQTVGKPLANRCGDVASISNAISNSNSKEVYCQVISYLNEKAERKYKNDTPKTIQFINARINEGFTLDDFKKVIDIKTTKWKTDPKMNEFLRPETLFGTKFESYLNEKIDVKPKVTGGRKYESY